MSWCARLCFCLALSACNPVPGPLPPPSPKPADAGTVSDCERACARLSELGCPEAERTPAGVACVDVCRTFEESGTVTLMPACVAEIKTCAEIERCSYGE